MVKAVLIPTTADRVEQFATLMDTLHRWAPPWLPCVVTQGWSQSTRDAMAGLYQARWLHLPEPVGPHRARQAALRKWQADVWCNLDDDMEVTAETNWDGAIHLALDPGTGLVSCNWLRSESPGLRRRARYGDSYQAQPIVYTGGGLLYSGIRARLFRGMLGRDYLFENIQWSLASYLAGFRNYRYFGSLTIHRACARGGRRAWCQQGGRVRPNPHWIRLEECSSTTDGTENMVRIPGSGNLTPEARAEHKQRRAETGCPAP